MAESFPTNCEKIFFLQSSLAVGQRHLNPNLEMLNGSKVTLDSNKAMMGHTEATLGGHTKATLGNTKASLESTKASLRCTVMHCDVVSKGHTKATAALGEGKHSNSAQEESYQ